MPLRGPGGFRGRASLLDEAEQQLYLRDGEIDEAGAKLLAGARHLCELRLRFTFVTCLPLRFEVDSVEPIAFVLTSSILIRRLELPPPASRTLMSVK